MTPLDFTPQANVERAVDADSFDQPWPSSLQLRRLPRARRMWSDLVICQPGTFPLQRWLKKQAKKWQSIAIIGKNSAFFPCLQHGAGDMQSSRAFPAPLASCHHCVECDRIGFHGVRKSSLHRATSGFGLWIKEKHFNKGSACDPTLENAANLGPRRAKTPSLSFRYLCLSYLICSWKWTKLSSTSSDHAPPDPGSKTQAWFVDELSFFDWLPTRPVVVKASDENLRDYMFSRAPRSGSDYFKSRSARLLKVNIVNWCKLTPKALVDFLWLLLAPPNNLVHQPPRVPAALQQHQSHPPGSAGRAGADGGVEADEIRLELPSTEAQQPGKWMGWFLGYIVRIC